MGRSISLSADGNTLAIGAPQGESGYVKVYNNINNEWIQIGQNINGEDQGDYSGVSVSISANGNILAIGAYSNNGNAGHVRLFKNVNNVWVQIGQDIDGEAEGDYSGESISLTADGKTLAIGASGGGDFKGYVRIFDLSSTLSLENFSLTTPFKLYPNPASDNVNIVLTENTNIQKITIRNNLGQVVSTSNSKTINTSYLQSGTYFIEIVTDAKEIIAKKIIIE